LRAVASQVSGSPGPLKEIANEKENRGGLVLGGVGSNRGICIVARYRLTKKTAKACVKEWQADKAAKRANGITQRAYLARCGAGSSNAAGDPQVHSSIKDLMESIIAF